jgi:hypothetical protein
LFGLGITEIPFLFSALARKERIAKPIVVPANNSFFIMVQSLLEIATGADL